MLLILGSLCDQTAVEARACFSNGILKEEEEPEDTPVCFSESDSIGSET